MKVELNNLQENEIFPYYYNGIRYELTGDKRLGSVKDPTALNNNIIVDNKKIEILVGYKDGIIDFGGAITAPNFLEQNGIYKDITQHLKWKRAIMYLAPFALKNEKELQVATTACIPNAITKGYSLVNISREKVNEDCWYWYGAKIAESGKKVENIKGETKKLEKSSNRFKFLTEYILGLLFNTRYLASAQINFMDQRNDYTSALIRGGKYFPYFYYEAEFPEEIKNKLDLITPKLGDIGGRWTTSDGQKYISNTFEKHPNSLAAIWFMDWNTLKSANENDSKWTNLDKQYKEFDYEDYFLDKKVRTEKDDKVITFKKKYSEKWYSLKIVIDEVGKNGKQAHPHIPAIYFSYVGGLSFNIYTYWGTSGYWFSSVDKEFTSLFKESTNSIDWLTELIKLAIADRIITLDESSKQPPRKVNLFNEDALNETKGWNGYIDWSGIFQSKSWWGNYLGSGNVINLDSEALTKYPALIFFDPQYLLQVTRLSGYNYYHPYNTFRKLKWYGSFTDTHMKWGMDHLNLIELNDTIFNNLKIGLEWDIVNKLEEKIKEDGTYTLAIEDLNYITEDTINNHIEELKNLYGQDSSYSLEKLPTDKPVLIDIPNTDFVVGVKRVVNSDNVIIELLPKTAKVIIPETHKKLHIANENKLGDYWNDLPREEKLALLVKTINQQNTLYIKGTKFPIKQKILLEKKEFDFKKFDIAQLPIDEKADSLQDHWLLQFESDEDSIHETISLVRRDTNTTGLSPIDLDEMKMRHYHERFLKGIEKERHILDFAKFTDLNRLRSKDIDTRDYYNNVTAGVSTATNLITGALSIWKSSPLGIVSSASGIANTWTQFAERRAALGMEREMLSHEKKFGIDKYKIDRDSLEEDKRYLDYGHRLEVMRATNNLNIHIANEADIQEEFWNEINKENYGKAEYGICIINRYCEGPILKKLIDYTKQWGFDVFIENKRFKKSWLGPTQYHRLDVIDIEHIESLAVIKENLLRGVYVINNTGTRPITELDRIKSKLNDFKWKLSQLSKEKEATEEKLKMLEDKRKLDTSWSDRDKKRLTEEKNKLQTDLNRKTQELEAKTKQYHELSENYRKKENELIQEKNQVTLYKGQVKTLQGEKSKLEQEKQTCLTEKETAIAKEKQTANTLESTTNKLQAKETEVQRQKLELEEKKGELTKKEGELKKQLEEKENTIKALREIETALRNRSCKDIWNSPAFKQIMVNGGKGFVIVKGQNEDDFYICKWNEKLFRWEAITNPEYEVKKYPSYALLALMPKKWNTQSNKPQDSQAVTEWEATTEVNNYQLNNWRSYYTQTITKYSELKKELIDNGDKARSTWSTPGNVPIAFIEEKNSFPVFKQEQISIKLEKMRDISTLRTWNKIINNIFCDGIKFYGKQNATPNKIKINGYYEYLWILGLEGNPILDPKEKVISLYGEIYKNWDTHSSQTPQIFHPDGIHASKLVKFQNKLDQIPQTEQYLYTDKSKKLIYVNWNKWWITIENELKKSPPQLVKRREKS